MITTKQPGTVGYYGRVTCIYGFVNVQPPEKCGNNHHISSPVEGLQVLQGQSLSRHGILCKWQMIIRAEPKAVIQLITEVPVKLLSQDIAVLDAQGRMVKLLRAGLHQKRAAPFCPLFKIENNIYDW